MKHCYKSVLAYLGTSCPDDAIFVGYNEENFKTYLGRVWYYKKLLPVEIILKNGQYTANLVNASKDTVHEFDFMRMDPGSYNWQISTEENFPSNAIVAGIQCEGTLRQTFYFGRVLLDGNYLYGRVHGMCNDYQTVYCFKPYRLRDQHFNSFEVLVKSG